MVRTGRGIDLVRHAAGHALARQGLDGVGGRSQARDARRGTGCAHGHERDARALPPGRGGGEATLARERRSAPPQRGARRDARTPR